MIEPAPLPARPRPPRRRTFTAKSSGGLGGFAAIWPPGLIVCALAMVAAPLRWHTSVWLAIPFAVAFAAAAVGLQRLANRLRVSRVALGPEGVEVTYSGHTRHLDWAQIARFAPGTVPAVSGLRGPVQLVVAELHDGSKVALDALRVDHGAFAAQRDRERVATLCETCEDCRPPAARRATA